MTTKRDSKSKSKKPRPKVKKEKLKDLGAKQTGEQVRGGFRSLGGACAP